MIQPEGKVDSWVSPVQQSSCSPEQNFSLAKRRLILLVPYLGIDDGLVPGGTYRTGTVETGRFYLLLTGTDLPVFFLLSRSVFINLGSRFRI